MIRYQDYKVDELPDSAYYIPNFITKNDEEYLLEKIYSSPKPKWKSLFNRRLQNWGGLPHSKGMVLEDLPKWLNDYVQKVTELEIFGSKKPNHVLINEYLPGQGIMPHEDGPLFYPTIATINLGSHTVLDYYDKPYTDYSQAQDMQMRVQNNNYIGLNHICSGVGSVLLERRSLLIVQDDLYDKYLHGIRELTYDDVNEIDLKNLPFCDVTNEVILSREKRISLTIRHVPKVVKAKLFFKMK